MQLRLALFPVVCARMQGALILLGANCCSKKYQVSPWRQFHNILTVIVGALTAIGGLLLCLYFLSKTLPLSYQNNSDEADESLLPFRPFLAFSPGQRFLVILMCCWGLTVGWTWGKESTLNWIPNSLTNFWRAIREESVRVNIKNAILRNRLHIYNVDSVDTGTTVNAANANSTANDIRRVLKRQIWSYSLEYVLGIPGSVIGILWDTMHCLTLTKGCRVADGEFPTVSPWRCSPGRVIVVGDKSQQKAKQLQLPQQLPADYNYEMMLKEKVEEVSRSSDPKVGKVFRKLRAMIIDNYLRDVISGKISEPVLPSRFTAQNSTSLENFTTLWWREYATLKNPQLEQMLKHGRRGSTLFEIARDYNAFLFYYKSQFGRPVATNNPAASTGSTVPSASIYTSTGNLNHPLRLLMPPASVVNLAAAAVTRVATLSSATPASESRAVTIHPSE